MIRRYFYIFATSLFILLTPTTGVKAHIDDAQLEALARLKNSPPEGFNYQAVLRDDAGDILANSTVSIRFTLSNSNGNLWIETHNATTNAFGVVTLVIGSGTNEGGSASSFATIDWSVDVSVKVEADSGSGFVDLGTTNLQSVPYAQFANNGLTSSDRTKLNNLSTAAEANVQADWSATDDASDAFIQNKPTIPADISDLTDADGLLSGTTFDGSFNNLTEVPTNLDTDATDDFSGSYNDLTDVPDNLDTDATDDFSGNYNDLINKPAIPSDINELTDTDGLLNGVTFDGSFTSLTNVPANLDTDATDDFSGSYNDLTDVPANLDTDATDDFSGSYNDLTGLPANLDIDATDDFSGSYDDLSDVPVNLDTDATDDFSGSYSDLMDVPANLDTDATDDFSGSYNDLTDVPVNLDTDATDDFSGSYSDLTDVPANLDTDATDDFSSSYNDLTDVPVNLDTDATDDFSGNYNDLTNKPTIPSDINELTDADGLLNGSTFDGSFTSLTNIPANLDTDATDDFSGDYNDLDNKPSIPANTSDLANDSGFITNDVTGTFTADQLRVDGGVALPTNAGTAGQVLATNGVNSAFWSSLFIGNTQLQNDAVTSEKITDETITSADIADGTITASDLASGLITTGSGTGTNSFLAGDVANNTASGTGSSVAGGSYNEASYRFAKIGGGTLNRAQARYATIPGGHGLIAGSYAMTVVGRYNYDRYGSFPSSVSSVYGDDPLFVVGNGTSNSNRSDALVVANSGNTSVSGTFVAQSLGVTGAFTLPTTDGNNAQFLATFGDGTTTWADPLIKTDNLANDAVTADKIADGVIPSFSGNGINSFVGGGTNNVNDSYNAVIGGGKNNEIDQYTFGSNNTAGNFIGGGYSNFIKASKYSVIAGGHDNYIDSSGGEYHYSTIAGGKSNKTYHAFAFVGGGNNNYAVKGASVSGGANNKAHGNYTTIPGGKGLSSYAQYSTIIGKYNSAGSDAATINGDDLDPFFVIGNGSDDANRSDILVMDRKGRTTLNGQLTLKLPGSPGNGITLPGWDGTNGQVLTTNGSGTITWSDKTSYAGFGLKSFATDYSLHARSYGEVALGFFNTYATGSSSGYLAGDRLLVVGNGSASTRSDALVMRKDGSTDINGSFVANSLGVDDVFTLPTTAGNDGEILTSDGAGGVNWETPTTSIATGAVTSTEILDGTITAADMAANVLPDATSDLTNDSGFLTSVASADIVDGTITAADMAANVLPDATSDLTNDSGFLTSVASANIVDGTITAADMAANVLPNATSDLTNDSGFLTSVASANIVDGTITAADMAANLLPDATSDLTNDSGFLTSVTSADIVNGTITAADLAANVLPNATSDLTNDSGFITSVASADIVDGTITATDMAANVLPDATSDLTNDSGFLTTVASADIVDGTITAADMAGNVLPDATSDLTNDSGFLTSVASANIVDGTITAADIAANVLPDATSDLTNDSGFLTSVGTSNISDGAITANKLAVLSGVAPLVFEGATTDGIQTTLGVAGPTVARTITIPDASGTIALTSQIISGAGSGSNSLIGVIGNSNGANGAYSTVSGGSGNTAGGNFSTVSGGVNNTAGVEATVGGGSGNYASGNRSTIPGGQGLTTSSAVATILGSFNNTTGGNVSNFTMTDPLLVVGNGTNALNRSDALVMLKNGNTTISGDFAAKSLAVDGAFGLPTTDGSPGQVLRTNGSGGVTWQSPLSTGEVTSTEILDGSIATADMASGAITTNEIWDGTITAADLAPGVAPFSNVSNVISAGDADDDFVFGSDRINDNTLTAIDNYRMFFDKSKGAFRVGGAGGAQWDDGNVGNSSTVTGGVNNIASGVQSGILGGYNNTAAYRANVTGGAGNNAAGNYSSVSGGAGNNANAQHSTVLGGRFNVTSGNGSIAGGSANTAGSYAEVVLGSHATEVAGNTTGITVTDRLFVLGNGINPSSRSDAFVVYKDGDATLAGNLTENSDRRLKRDITSLGSTLDKVNQLEGVRYKWNDLTPRDTAEVNIGLIAQDVEKLFPELVQEGSNGYKTVNYIDLIPVLIEAVKELSSENAKLKANQVMEDQRYVELKASNEALNSKVDMLMKLFTQSGEGKNEHIQVSEED